MLLKVRNLSELKMKDNKEWTPSKGFFFFMLEIMQFRLGYYVDC